MNFQNPTLKQHQNEQISSSILQSYQQMQKDQKLYKNLPLSDDQNEQQPTHVSEDQFKSDHLQKYLDLMEQKFEKQTLYNKGILAPQKIQKTYSSEVQQLENTLKQNKISVITSELLIKSIKVHNIIEHAGYQIVDLDVCVGKYQKNIKIYNLLEESCFHLLKPFNSGSFGNIYAWSFMQQEFVVKCVSKNKKNNDQKLYNFKENIAIFKGILKEYMIAYIAGVLQVGPKVLSPFGFDLLVSRKCIEFFVEKCTLPQYNFEDTHQKLQEVKSSLFKLHMLNIVHNDIKPDNLMVSQRTEKLLFIDFGLSQYGERPIGHKKNTKFIGTYQYSSPQMQKLLFDKGFGMIDLYYNDAYSLDLTLNKLFQIQRVDHKEETRQQSAATHKEILNFLNKLFFKFLIWQQKVDQAITLGNMINIRASIQLQQQIMTFLQKLRYSPELRQFYHQCINQSVRERPSLKRLHDKYIKNVSFGDIEFLQKNQDYRYFQNLYQHLQNMQDQITEEQTTFKQRSITKDQKKLLLVGNSENFSEEKIWSLYLDFINFLKRNEMISVQEKYEVSVALMKKYQIGFAFTEPVRQQIEPLLVPILECLYFLLKRCLVSPTDRHRRKNMLKIISQMLILGWNIPLEFLELWKRLLCLNSYEQNKILTCYLQFQLLTQIAINRSFKIQNETCLKEIDVLFKVKYKEENGDEIVKLSIYQHVIEQRNRWNSRGQNKILLNLFISMLQLDQNPQVIIQEKLDFLLDQIESLNLSIFKTKSKGLWAKNQLMFWLDMSYSKLRIDHQKQLKVLQRIKRNSSLNNSTYELQVYHFQIMLAYHNLKNFPKLKDQLEYLDKTINCSLVSDNMGLPRRLMLSFMLKDSGKFKQIVGKLQTIKVYDITEIDLYRHIAYIYQNIYFFQLANRTNCEFLEILRNKIDNNIHQYINDFLNSSQLRQTKNNRLSFVMFLRAIFGMDHPENQQTPISHQSIIIQNIPFYMKALQKLSQEFSDTEVVKTYLCQNMSYLSRRKKYVQACIFLQQQNKINLSDFKLSNYRETIILVQYYYSKSNLNNNEKDIYINKLKEVYQELLKRNAYNLIFSNTKLLDLILNNSLNDPEETFLFFKGITEHTTKHPSSFNVGLLISYIKIFVCSKAKKKQFQHQSNSSPANNIERYGNMKDKGNYMQNQSNYDQQFFNNFYQCIREKIKTEKLWQNPYIILLLYSISLYAQMYREQIIKINKMVARTLKFLIYPARQFILNFYYWRVSANRTETESDRRRTYLFTKHFKLTSSSYYFEVIVSLRSNSLNLNSSKTNSFPGHSHMRKKLYKYYDNLDIVKKVNHLDRISIF